MCEVFNMANKSKSDTSRIVVNNPLLSAANSDFVLENLTKNAVLLPVTHNSPSVLSEDVGEVDSFLGQDAPSSTLPSVIGLPSLPSTTSASASSSSSLWSTPSRPFNYFSSQQQPQQPQLQHPPAVSHSPFEQISNHPPSSYTPSSFLSGTSTSPLPPANQSQLPINRVPPSSTPVLHVAPVTSPSNVSSLFSSSSASAQWNFQQQQFAATPAASALVTASNFAALDTTTNTTPVLSLSSSTSSESFASPSAPSPPYGSSVFQSFSPSPVYGKKDITPSPLAPGHQFQPIHQPGFQNCSTGPLVAPPIATVAPIAGSTNTYRLGSQKKPLYAQPPGLSLSTPVITSYAPSESYSPTPAAVAPPFVPSATNSMATTQTAAAATLTPLQLPSPAPTQYQSPVAAVPDSNQSTATSYTNLGQPMHMYRQVYHHWFYKKEVENKVIWQPFSMTDSLALEQAFTSTDISPETLVATDGGRYDVNILRRQRMAVYWQETPTEVRRCSWFYKGPSDTRYVPYEENISTRLEEEFKTATTTNSWHRRVELPNGEAVVFHGPGVMVHFPQATSPDAWSNAPQSQVRPRVVKRGVDEFDIDEGEPAKIDHLLFLVHGIGSVCDLKFRTVEEVVDEFRSLSLQLVQSHFHTAQEQGLVNRIEVLPISWHATLHGEDTGIDRKLKAITLKSIPKLRHFTNDTLLDILFYTSPVYCQTIVNTVGKELNRLYSLFCQRNPNFQGGVSLGGHSLGSLILFDLLYHQKPVTEEEPLDLETSSCSRETSEEPVEENVGKVKPSQQKLNHRVSYVVGNAGTGQPFITYPQLTFQPKAFYALGSPIGMFVTVRGIDTLGEDFCLPTCPGFFNIFHPFDPVAYRIETLVNPDLTDLRPVLIPHHKGRKRMHLELKETMARVGADLKQKLVESIRSTWNTVYQLAMFHRTDDQLEQEVDKVLEEQIKQQQDTDSSSGTDAEADLDICVGQLNGGRRIDYVLQEAPLESFNEYLFAMKTHVCYWESEDTMLMILKEIYSLLGISADSQVSMQSSSRTPTESAVLGGMEDLSLRSQSEPQTYTLDVQGTAAYLTSPPGMAPPPFTSRTTSLPAVNQQMNLGMDPTAPMSENKNIGPPPISGFVKKS